MEADGTAQDEVAPEAEDAVEQGVDVVAEADEDEDDLDDLDDMDFMLDEIENRIAPLA